MKWQLCSIGLLAFASLPLHAANDDIAAAMIGHAPEVVRPIYVPYLHFEDFLITLMTVRNPDTALPMNVNTAQLVFDDNPDAFDSLLQP